MTPSSAAATAAPRHAFVHVVTTLVGLHACMAATRVAAVRPTAAAVRHADFERF